MPMQICTLDADVAVGKMGVVSKQLSIQICKFTFISSLLTRIRGDLKTCMVEKHLLLLYRVVAYVRFWGGQQVYIYFRKLRPMALRLQTKDAHTVDSFSF